MHKCLAPSEIASFPTIYRQKTVCEKIIMPETFHSTHKRVGEKYLDDHER